MNRVPWPRADPVDSIALTSIEQLVVWGGALVLLTIIIGFLCYHRGRHVQAQFDRRVEARKRRRFLMSKVVDFGKSETYLLHAFGKSGREMPVPQPATIALTPLEVVTAEFSPDGKAVIVTNNNPTDGEVNVVIAVSAGGLAASANLTCRPEVPVTLTLEEQP